MIGRWAAALVAAVVLCPAARADSAPVPNPDAPQVSMPAVCAWLNEYPNWRGVDTLENAGMKAGYQLSGVKDAIVYAVGHGCVERMDAIVDYTMHHSDQLKKST